MEYNRGLTGALEFAQNGKIEEWIDSYLRSDGNNIPFADGLKLCKRYYYPPMEFDTSMFVRICGPEDSMKYKVDRKGFEKKVEGLMNAIAEGADMPPLIVSYHRGEGFELNDGNHRLEAYSRLKTPTVYAIVWITEEADKEEFERLFTDCEGKQK